MPRPPRTSTLDVTLAGATTAISLALLLLLPLIDELDADLSDATPDPTQWAWWAVASAVIVQGVCLLWASARPRAVLIATPAIALIASLAPLGAVANITLIAMVPAAYVATRRRGPAQSWLPWALALVLATGAGLLTTLRDPDATPALAIGSAVLQALLMLGIPSAIAQGVRGRAAPEGQGVAVQTKRRAAR